MEIYIVQMGESCEAKGVVGVHGQKEVALAQATALAREACTCDEITVTRWFRLGLASFEAGVRVLALRGEAGGLADGGADDFGGSSQPSEQNRQGEV